MVRGGREDERLLEAFLTEDKRLAKLAHVILCQRFGGLKVLKPAHRLRRFECFETAYRHRHSGGVSTEVRLRDGRQGR